MIFDPDRKLNGTKVVLIGLVESHADGNYPGWFNDPEVCRYNSHGGDRNTKEKTLDYIRSVRASKDAIVFAILAAKNQQHIGNISLQSIDFKNLRAEVAIIIGEKEYWGEGYAREAWKLAINFGFQDLKLNRLYCGTREDNIGMQKVALASGMKEEGRFRKHIFKDGKFYDQINYGIVIS